MARKGIKKDAYWHNIAKLGISSGFKPAQIGRLVKECSLKLKSMVDTLVHISVGL